MCWNLYTHLFFTWLPLELMCTGFLRSFLWKTKLLLAYLLLSRSKNEENLGKGGVRYNISKHVTVRSAYFAFYQLIVLGTNQCVICCLELSKFYVCFKIEKIKNRLVLKKGNNNSTRFVFHTVFLFRSMCANTLSEKFWL